MKVFSKRKFPGIVGMHALASLEFDFTKPVIGGNVWTAIENRLGDSVSSGSVYNALASLVEHGFVSEGVTTEGRPARTYEITSEGQKILEKFTASISQNSEATALRAKEV